jgi:predicted patatin/cPLA2 family phospholipase
MDFLFGELPEKLEPFDYAAFAASPCAYYAGATHVKTGGIVWFGKDYLAAPMPALRASCSIPLLSPMVEIEGELYLDGGVAQPIPLEKALEDGCERVVVVLTRPRGYRKKPQSWRAVTHWVYRRYPAFVKTMDLRHLVYNHTLERLARLEAEGRAVVVAPPGALKVDRFGKDAAQLAAAYEVGMDCGQKALEKIIR